MLRLLSSAFASGPAVFCLLSQFGSHLPSRSPRAAFQPVGRPLCRVPAMYSSSSSLFAGVDFFKPLYMGLAGLSSGFCGDAKTAIRYGHSPQLLPQHLHQAFMPLLRIVLVISNSHSQDASRIFRLLSKLSFQPKGILPLLNLPDGFRRCMINL